MKNVEISKIRLEIGKKKVDLSTEEARELHKVLSDLFGVTKRINRTTVILSPPVTGSPYPSPAPCLYEWWRVKPTWIDGKDSIITISSSQSTSSGDVEISTKKGINAA